MSGHKASKNVDKYLAHHAECEVKALSSFPCLKYDHVLLIPTYRESECFVHRLVDQFKRDNVLLILVINQPEHDDDSAPQQLLWQHLCEKSTTHWQANNLRLGSFEHSTVQILMVDRFSEGVRIPVKQGVGLARKIAADLACALIHVNRVKQSQIYSSDADAELPDDYFQNSLLPEGTSAGVFNFVHISCGDPIIDAATALYERRLHYYVEGLKYAGSGYAFHTIGSCLCFDMLAYCQARGFPKKSGGEDFYLLNKLAKSGKVAELLPCIRIRARLSDRVPFGTGPAVASIVEQGLIETSYKVYHPEIFNRLKRVLAALNKLCEEAKLGDFGAGLDDISKCFFEQASFEVQFQKWQKQYNQTQLLTAVNQWFDAFRTLKYVHFLQANELPDIALVKATTEFPKKQNTSR